MLAIIVVPILHAFVTSSKTSHKAKEVRNQTVTAQNILESYEATDLGTIIADIKNHVTPFTTIAGSAQVFIKTSLGQFLEITSDSTEPADGPSYKILLRNVTTDYKAYDAVLNVSAGAYAARNAAGIVDYKPMDAVYIQPEPGSDGNPDVQAAKDFASQAQIDSGAVVDFSYFLDRMTRMITVTAQKIGAESGVISCTALFRYSTHFTYTLTDDSTDPPTVTTYEKDYTASVSNDFYSGSYAESGDSIYGLYVFFYPNPNASGDKIEIFNRDNIDMSVYLVRQAAAGADPVIILREKYDPSTKPPHAQMFYNRAQHAYRYYIGYPSGGSFSDYWYNTYMFNGSLIGTPAQNRLYGLTVELYETGSIQADGTVTGNPLATFDASSLE
jgi:hypothetical protein